MKIALFGGSFDPFHSDHLKMIKLVKECCDIQEVWIIPTNQNPFKTRKLSPITDRLNMIKLAIQGLDYVKINDLELKNNAPSITYQTVKTLHEQDPTNQFYFMIGSDQLDSLDKWNNINELVKLQTFIIFERNHWDVTPEILTKYQAISVTFKNNTYLSSTLVREGKNLDLQLPAINNYINDHLLYLEERIRDQMDEKRYFHCLNVGKKAQELAIIHHLDDHKALIAGTFHDVTKRWSEEHQRDMLIEYWPEGLTEPVPTWHSYTGFLHLKYDLLFTDEEILNAVKWHTVGHPEMTLFEMLIFIADKISAERNYPGVEELRKLANEDLTLTFKEMLKRQYEIASQKHGVNNLGTNILKTYKAWITEQ